MNALTLVIAATVTAVGTAPAAALAARAPQLSAPIVYGDVQVDGDPLPELAAGTIDTESIGVQVPVIRGEDYAGRPVDIGVPDDTPMLVMVVAHWCPHCDVAIADYHDWGSDLEVWPQEGLAVVALSSAVEPDDPTAPPGLWLKRHGWIDMVLADDAGGTARRALGFDYFTAYVLIDADGTLLWRAGGGAIEFGDVAAAIAEYLPAQT